MQRVANLEKIRILLVDDHMVIRMGLMTATSDTPDMEVVADVESGQEARVDLAIIRGTITLSVQTTVVGGGQANGFGWIASGSVTAANGRELNLRLAELGDSFSKLGVFMLGQPLEYKELLAGDFTVCVLPLPAGLGPMEAGS